MEKNLSNTTVNKTIPLSLITLLLLSKPVMASENTEINVDSLSDKIQQNDILNNQETISRPTLIPQKDAQKELLISLATNGKQNQFPLSENQELSIANQVKLTNNLIEKKPSSLIGLENGQNSVSIPISVIPNNNQASTKIPVITHTDNNNSENNYDPNNYSPDVIPNSNISESESKLVDSGKNVENSTQTIPITVNNSQFESPQSLKENSSSVTSVDQIFPDATTKVHQVKSGETINSIARNYGIDKYQLMKANKLENPNLIKVNQTLTIPSSNFETPTKPVLITVDLKHNTKNNVVSNLEENRIKVEDVNQSDFIQNDQNDQNNTNNFSDNLPVKKEEQIASSSTAIDIEYYNPADQISPRQMVSPDLPNLPSSDQYLPKYNQPFNGYIWPSKGVLTSGYGWRWGRMHKGIDIAAPVGTPILAASDGEVISAGWSSGGYGNLVRIRHFDGSITLYAHNSRILVTRGQRVTQGQQIAAMGSTGYSTGSHLHFEIHPQSGKAINPMAFLPQK